MFSKFLEQLYEVLVEFCSFFRKKTKDKFVEKF